MAAYIPVKVLMTPPYPVEGIDISSYQVTEKVGINFGAAKKTRPSLKFCYIKAGEGLWDGYPLKVFQTQMAGALEGGWDAGIFHYWHPEFSPDAQAKYLRRRVPDSLRGNLPPMLDIEDTLNHATQPPTNEFVPRVIVEKNDFEKNAATATKLFNGMLDYFNAVANEFGVQPIWYGSDWYQSWFVRVAEWVGIDISPIKKIPFWCASYTSPYLYLPYGINLDQVIIWQYTSRPAFNQQINGFPMPSALDMDFWLKSVAEYELFAGRSTQPLPPPLPVNLTDKQKLDRLVKAHSELFPELKTP